MFTYKTFNNIAEDGLALMAARNIKETSDNPDGLILRSHKLAAEEFGSKLSAIARAGAGVNNVPIEEATKIGVVVFNTPGANANAVKELVICGMLLSSRGIVQGINFAKTLESDDADALNKMLEAQKKIFCWQRAGRQNTRYCWVGCNRVDACTGFSGSWHETNRL